MNKPQRRGPLSDAEVACVFEAMGLATQEQRVKLLLQESVDELTEPIQARYVTRLSHSSQPEPTEED